MSRALGDHPFKQPLNRARGDFISAEPHIEAIQLDFSVHDFMILASDGLWNILDDQTAVNIVGKLWREGLSAQVICERLVSHLANTPYSDNVTCMLVLFNKYPGRQGGHERPPSNVDTEAVQDIVDKVMNSK